MPISEDEYEMSGPEPTSNMSKAELRKTHKPIMEKRRRARINQCLNEIKGLILEALKKDPARHTKLEKADILEMAVKHLQNVQRQQLAMAMAADPTILRKFKAGFNECSREVGQYITQVDERATALKDRVGSHLTKCISSIEHIAKYNFPGSLPLLGNSINLYPQGANQNIEDSGDQNNNPRVQGIQLIPSRLPTGELAFLLPNSNNLSFANVENAKQSERASAFAAVIPSSLVQPTHEPKTLSPPLSPKDDVIIIDPPRTPSPRGFRPVNPTLHKSYQSAFITTANLGNRLDDLDQLELKSIKYPIHKKISEPLCIITNQSERFKQAQTIEETSSFQENIRQSERFKQAQTIEETSSFQENIRQSERFIKQAQTIEETSSFQENIRHGVKRKFVETAEHQGLLTVAPNDFLYPSKVMKTTSDAYVTYFRSAEPSSGDKGEAQASTSRQPEGGQCENSNDMWRPW